MCRHCVENKNFQQKLRKLFFACDPHDMGCAKILAENESNKNARNLAITLTHNDGENPDYVAQSTIASNNEAIIT